MATTQPQQRVPGFGELYGPPISNIATIIKEIDDALQPTAENDLNHTYSTTNGSHHIDSYADFESEAVGKTFSLEYLISYPIGYITLPFNLGSISYNTYGHSLIRYIDINGNDVVANVEAKEEGKAFIQFYSPEQYLFGTDPKTCGAQRGVYNRNFIGVRVYNIPKDQLADMHNHILYLIAKEHQEIKFNIILGPILNFIRELLPSRRLPEFGNCSKWTSTMLQKAGVVHKIFVWPRTIFIDLFESAHKRGFKTDVVFYEQPRHIERLTLGVKSKPLWFEGVAPFQFIRNWTYGDLKAFATVWVTIPPGSTTAVVTKNPHPVQPSAFRNILNNKYVIMANVSCSMYVTYRGYKFVRRIIKAAAF